MQHLNGQVAYFQQLVIFGNVRFKTRLCGRAINNSRAGFFSEVEVAGYEVGVEVGFQYIFDFGSVFSRAVNIWLHFAERVNDGCFAVAFDIICAVRQTTGIDLFDLHEWNDFID